MASEQLFTPWGQVRAGGIGQTTMNDTGQRLDGSGLLYSHARYYDPALARFVSADSVVPGSATGSMDGVALKPLTVDFHAPGFASTLAGENAQPFWFQLSGDQRQQASYQWGPANPQALNRHSYVQNRPVNATDPTGHTWYLNRDEAAGLALALRDLASDLRQYASDGTFVGYGLTTAGIVAKVVGESSPVLGPVVLSEVGSLILAIGVAVAFGGATVRYGVRTINQMGL